jgi:hypothetical protein
MAAYNLNVDQVLAVLKQNPSFNQLPQDWQMKLAGQVHDNGIDAAVAMNSGWLQGNRNNPISGALGSWLQQAPQARTSLTSPPPEVTAPSTPDLPQADFDSLVARANAGDAAAIAALEAAGYELAADTEDLPLEQGILQTALPGLLGDIEGDAGRRQLVDTLTGQVTGDYNAARNALSPEENARRLAEEYAMADTTSTALSDSAATASAEQLAALNQSIESMKSNLSGDLAARAAALQQQIASLTANLDTLSAEQKAALAEQITANQANLEQSIASQQQNLATELEALRGGVDTRTQARSDALTQELASLRDVNTAEGVARKAALQQEIASLRTASTAENQARVAALQAEIEGLTAAQAPMAQARLDSANALTTAVNLGLESTNDRLTAERARQGYLGSSSFSDANLARAAIGARQQGAQAMGSAREANAGDIRAIQARAATEGRSLADILAGRNMSISGREATEGRNLADYLSGNERDIGVRGATGTRGIADEAANAQFDITSRGATGTRSLADILAEGTRSIGDTGAAGTAAIRNNTAQSLAGIKNAGANQTYADTTGGSIQLRTLLDTLAQGQAGIAGNLSTQQQTARDMGTTARQGYFDNAYTRGQGGILSRPGLGSQLAGTLTDLGNYGSSGLNRSLGTLNWWAGGGQAPTPGYTPVQASTSGNDIAGLGAGLVGTAMNIGNSNSWWAKPAGAGSKTSYEQFLKDNPTSWAATGQP